MVCACSTLIHALDACLAQGASKNGPKLQSDSNLSQALAEGKGLHWDIIHLLDSRCTFTARLQDYTYLILWDDMWLMNERMLGLDTC